MCGRNDLTTALKIEEMYKPFKIRFKANERINCHMIRLYVIYHTFVKGNIKHTKYDTIELLRNI